MARLRRSVSGGPSSRFVGELPPGRLDRSESPHLVTVEEFYRECILALVRNASKRGRG